MKNSKAALSHIFRPGYQLSLRGAWLNVNGKDSFNECHIHQIVIFAGVFWINAPEESGDLIIINDSAYSNLTFMHFSIRTQIFCWMGIDASCWRDGFFPANMLHKVNINNSSENRISIAFNLRLG